LSDFSHVVKVLDMLAVLFLLVLMVNDALKWLRNM
jgi:hypothetical protein